jgi:hypothetical protein
MFSHVSTFSTVSTCSVLLSVHSVLSLHVQCYCQYIQYCLYMFTVTVCTFSTVSTCLVLLSVKKFPAFYGTRNFITAFTSTHHLFLSWASSIQSIPPHPTSWISILILSSIYARVSQVASFPQVSHQNPGYASPIPHTRYMSLPSHSSRFCSPEQYWVSSTDHKQGTY